MRPGRLSLIFAIAILAVTPSCVTSALDWECIRTPLNLPLGPIEVNYTLNGTVNRVEVFAFTPQNSNILLPKDEAMLQVHSWRCFEFTIVMRNSSGTAIADYTGLPYSPLLCSDHRETAENDPFLTAVMIELPEEAGMYSLDVYDDQGVLLTTTLFEIPELSAIVPSIMKKRICRNGGSDYEIVMNLTYPVTDGRIGIAVKGENITLAKEFIEAVYIGIGYQSQDDLEGIGNPVCTGSECRQEYMVEVESAFSDIVYVFHQIRVSGPTTFREAVISETVLFINGERFLNMKKKLDWLTAVSAEYVEYYTDIGDAYNAGKWQRAHGILETVSNDVGDIATPIETGRYTIGDILAFRRVGRFSNAVEDIIATISGSLQ